MTAKSVTLESSEDAAWSFVATRGWVGFCSKCLAEITRESAPPPCHQNRMRCKKCRNESRLKARANWIAKNPEAERKHRRKCIRRNTEKKRARSRELAESTGARWSGEEESFLLRNIGKMTQEQIGIALGRSFSSIEVKLWRLRSALSKNADTLSEHVGL